MLDSPLLALLMDEQAGEGLREGIWNARWGTGLLILVASKVSCLVNVEETLDISYNIFACRPFAAEKIGNGYLNNAYREGGFLFFQLRQKVLSRAGRQLLSIGGGFGSAERT